MATALVGIPLLLKRFEKRLNPCRYCGEPGEIQRRESSYRASFEFRASCKVVCWPFYWEEQLTHHEAFINLAGFYSRLEDIISRMVNAWNHYHDGPGFIAGLA